MTLSKSFKSHSALLLSNIIFGANYSFYLSLINQGVSSNSVYFIRTVSSFIFFFPLMFILGEAKIVLKDIWYILIVTLLIVIGRQFLMIEAMNYTSPIDGSIIATTGPAIVLILSVFVLKQKAGLWQYVGVVMGLAGALTLILTNPTQGNSLLSGKMLGNILLLISITCSSINTIYIKELYKKYHPMTIVGWTYALGMLFIIPFFGKEFISNDFAAWSKTTWWSLAYMSVIGTVLATGLLYYALNGLSSTVITVYAYTQPVVATAMAIFMGQDSLTPITIIAAIFIFAGLFCMEKNKAKNPHRFQDNP